MLKIKAELEEISATIASLEARYPEQGRPENIRCLLLKWREYRRGIVRACRLLGMRPEIVSCDGLKWNIVLDTAEG